MRVEITVSYTKRKIVELDATPENFRPSMLAAEADTLAGDSTVPLEWDRTTFETDDDFLGEIK